MEITISEGYLIGVTIVLILSFINALLGLVKVILGKKISKMEDDDRKYFKIPIVLIKNPFSIDRRDKNHNIINLQISDEWGNLSHQLLSKITGLRNQDYNEEE